MRQGARFHHMVNQHLSGIPADSIHPGYEDLELSYWWENYLSDQPADVEVEDSGRVELHPEITLLMPFENYQLIAKFDLVAITSDGKALIFDWKTSRSQPPRDWLESRLQTHVYPYILASAGASLNQGKPIFPSQIEMIYWYANSPETPERFPYDETRFEEDHQMIADMIGEITGLAGAEEFPLTEDERKCRYCVYRSLDDRGVEAGDSAEFIDPTEGDQDDLTVDFDQIAEIEF